MLSGCVFSFLMKHVHRSRSGQQRKPTYPRIYFHIACMLQHQENSHTRSLLGPCFKQHFRQAEILQMDWFPNCFLRFHKMNNPRVNSGEMSSRPHPRVFHSCQPQCVCMEGKRAEGEGGVLRWLVCAVFVLNTLPCVNSKRQRGFDTWTPPRDTRRSFKI